ncbi:unnamed protein product [Knipowitschia caucasica]
MPCRLLPFALVSPLRPHHPLHQRSLCSLASAPPSTPHGLRYPSSSGGRKYRTQQQDIAPAQVDQILRANEQSHTFPKGSACHGVLGFHSNTLASNQPSEDRRSAATCLAGRGALMFGVFDGHDGSACAQAVSHRLFYYMAVAALPLRILGEMENAAEEERPAPPLLEWHRHPSDPSELGYGSSVQSLRTYWQDRLQQEEEDEVSVSAGLVSAFKRLDFDISVEAQVHLSRGLSSSAGPLQVALSGCTACVALVSQGTLHVANLGDSRAVLGVQDEDGGWSAQSLSHDHNADNPHELQRILGEHPASERRALVRHERLLGLLLPFRSFGDVRFKWSGDLLRHVPDVLVPPHYHTPPYLSAQPEVTQHHIRPRDKFLVLATDGLWELMHRQTVVQVVAQLLTGLQHQRPLQVAPGLTLGGLQRALRERRGRVRVDELNAASLLLRHALGDDGYGGVELTRLQRTLSLPPEVTRRYRDDITVTVLLLNQPDA